MADTASSQDQSASRRALVISFVPFGGFQRKNERLRLGWMVFSTIPSDVEDQLKRAREEIASLRAENARVSDEGRQQLTSALDENQALKTEMTRITADTGERLETALKENQALQAQISRVSSENERLQALMERVSSGVR